MTKSTKTTFYISSDAAAKAAVEAKLPSHDFGAVKNQPVGKANAVRGANFVDTATDKAFTALSAGVIVALQRRFPDGFTKAEGFSHVVGKHPQKFTSAKKWYESSDDVSAYQRLVSAMNNALCFAQNEQILPSQNQVKDLVNTTDGTLYGSKEEKAAASGKSGKATSKRGTKKLQLPKGATQNLTDSELISQHAVKPKAPDAYAKLTKSTMASKLQELVAFSQVFARCSSGDEIAKTIADFHATCAEINEIKA